MSYALGLLFMSACGFVAGFYWYAFEAGEIQAKQCVVAGGLCAVLVPVVIFALDTWMPGVAI